MGLLVTLLTMLDTQCAVRIENPQAMTLALFEVIDDASQRRRGLGQDERYDLRLSHGAYWIEARHGAQVVRLPLPLPRRARLPEVLVVPVSPPPPPEDGWCWIPAGPALRGDVIGIGQEDERPARVADVPGFWISRDEVTNARFAAFLNAASAVDERWLSLESRKLGITREGGVWTATRPNEPVITMSWFGASAYCAWLTKTTGRAHHLPTESQWEKAARGPESFIYAYGNIYRNSGANHESGRLREVGSFGQNGFGIRDMTGNAFEWVSDAYDDAPPPVPGLPPHRVLRGGSFVLDGMYLRNSFRMYHRPSVRADDFGFRVAREQEKKR